MHIGSDQWPAEREDGGGAEFRQREPPSELRHPEPEPPKPRARQANQRTQRSFGCLQVNTNGTTT